MFEDSESGVAAGKAAGCTVIATLFTHPAEDLEGADIIVKDADPSMKGGHVQTTGW